MIVSHHLSMVFIKTRKTAGTSIELALSTECGSVDVITPVTPEDEQLRRAIGGRGPQNYRAPWWTLRPADLGSMLTTRRRRPPRFYNHMSAREVIAHLGQHLWDDYFTFSIERNPWDKAVSRYFWESSRRRVADFSSFLRDCPRHLLTCFDLYANDNDDIMVDAMLRYERLQEDMSSMWRQLGVAPVSLTHAKGSHRPKSRDYRELYSDEDVAFIASVCSREIAAFGYSF